MTDLRTIMNKARSGGLCVPAFNVPYLPMVKPVIEAVVAERSFALVEVARLEWEKFESGSLEAVKEEYDRWADPSFVRLHLDHIPVIDEDDRPVDYECHIRRALSCGYDSVMVDGSRLPLEENIRATQKVADLARAKGVPCEAELGAVLGHEEGPLPPYEELFATGKGFTDPEEAHRFARESGCDWLSVAIGNVHGAVSRARRDEKKVTARLNLEHLDRLSRVTGLPLVLHGGSGIRPEDVRAAFHRGITKMNIGTEIRQVYEQSMRDDGDVEAAREMVYERVRLIISETLRLSGTQPGL